MKNVLIAGVLLSLLATSCSKDELICTISSPVGGTEFTVGDAVLIEADASNEGAAVSTVAFYVDDALLGTVSTEPYSITWVSDGATNGNYVIKATATDDEGNIVSDEVTISIVGGREDVTYTWTAVSSLPGAAREDAVAFSLGGFGYVGLGTEYPNVFKDFYKYDPSNDTWTQLKDFPGYARRGAVAFVLGNNAYVGLGYGEVDGEWGDLFDFWKYDPSNDSWVQLNEFTEYYIGEDASTFVLNSKAYLVMPGNSFMFEYNESTDSWTEKKQFEGAGRDNAASFSIGSNGYFGTGYDDDALSDFWKYDPASDAWTQLSRYPGGAVSATVSFTLNGLGFVGMGNSFFESNDAFYNYNPTDDSWAGIAEYPDGEGNGQVAFVIGDVAYVGTGFVSDLGPFGANKQTFYKLEGK